VQYSAPWVVESLGGTVTTSAYNDGKKSWLSAERGSGNPKKSSQVKLILSPKLRANPQQKLFEQNNTFTRAYRKSGHRLSENENRAEAHKRQKEMRGAARAAEMTEEDVALEKLKGLAEKKPRARLQQGKQARPSAYRKKSRARLQRGKQARSSAYRKKPVARLQRGKLARPSAYRKKSRVST
jgi:hypothetical protein